MENQKTRHVFISYVRNNQKEVDKLCEELTRHGVKVWLDRNDIKPGARWQNAVRQAIREGDFFIACFSAEYGSRDKSYMNEELTLAIKELRKYANDRIWFIPVLLDECDVPALSIGAGETLLDINWVPLYENWEAGIRRILDVIKPIPLEVQRLINALSSDVARVRASAVEALGENGDPTAVPVLIQVLSDEDKYVRRMAAGGLEKMSPEAKEAVPALIQALEDDDWFGPWAAMDALKKIGTLEALKAVEGYKRKRTSLRRNKQNAKVK